MTNVYWLTQSVPHIPPENDWLSAREAHDLQRLRYAPRRSDWRLGRWTAKCAVAAYLNQTCSFEALSNIEIRPAASGAPEVFPLTAPADVTISLSHRDGTALCAVAPTGTSLGCDLELIEPHSDAFLLDYFTTEEQERVATSPATERPLILSLLWSTKESALKALHEGLRLDTREAVVSLPDTFSNHSRSEASDASAHGTHPSLGSLSSTGLTWRPLQVRCGNGQLFHGWWRRAGHLVQTLVATPPPAYPIRLAHVRPQKGSDVTNATAPAIDNLRQI